MPLVAITQASMFILSRLQAYVSIGLIVVVLGYALWQTHQLAGSRAKEAELAETLSTLQKEALAAHVSEEQKKRNQSERIARVAEFVRDQTYEDVRALTVQRDALIERLRKSKATANLLFNTLSKTSPDTKPSELASIDNGSVILGSFGEEDVLEAERADTIRVHYIACKSQYDAVREELSK